MGTVPLGHAQGTAGCTGYTGPECIFALKRDAQPARPQGPVLWTLHEERRATCKREKSCATTRAATTFKMAQIGQCKASHAARETYLRAVVARAQRPQRVVKSMDQQRAKWKVAPLRPSEQGNKSEDRYPTAAAAVTRADDSLPKGNPEHPVLRRAAPTEESEQRPCRGVRHNKSLPRSGVWHLRVHRKRYQSSFESQNPSVRSGQKKNNMERTHHVPTTEEGVKTAEPPARPPGKGDHHVAHFEFCSSHGDKFSPGKCCHALKAAASVSQPRRKEQSS